MAPTFKDSFVSIYEHKDIIFAEWNTIQPRDSVEPKDRENYMEAKLAEYIGNKFPGAWFVRADEEVKDGKFRYFGMKWSEDKTRLEVVWQ